MKIFQFKSRLFLLCATTFLAIFLVACTSKPVASTPITKNCPDNNRVVQSFAFGGYGGKDSDIEILNVYYGVPDCPVNYDSEKVLFKGKPMQGTSIHGPLRRAHKLYVKWRIKRTGQEFEDTVDLRNRLPKDMTKHGVHFTIKASQLYVYLITPERRPLDMPPNGPRETQFLKTLTIYPDQTK